MLNNLLSIHDLEIIAEKMRQGELRRIAGWLLRNRGRSGKSWEHTAEPLRNWWDIPAVMERWNIMISGSASVDYCDYFLAKHIVGSAPLRSLSIGCGTGAREVSFARSGRFAAIDAVDVSAARIAYAVARARELGLVGPVNYITADILTVDLPLGAYDLVIAEQTLHHIRPLERLLERVDRLMAPGGRFIFNEFVGPVRFQWTEAQLSAVNELLARLPERLRVRGRSGTIKRAVHRPSRLAMMLYDPTEAAESERILPLIGRTFEIIELKGYGGTVLQILLADIAHNFLGGDPDSARSLAMLFDAEDAALRDGLPHDFVVGICGKRQGMARG